MSLMTRLMAKKLAKPEVRLDEASIDAWLDRREALPPPPPPPPPAGARLSCKAINAETGRQCALLGGHTGTHRHGRTDFMRTAEIGQTTFARRQALDGLANSRSGSPFTTPATGD